MSFKANLKLKLSLVRKAFNIIEKNLYVRI